MQGRLIYSVNKPHRFLATKSNSAIEREPHGYKESGNLNLESNWEKATTSYSTDVDFQFDSNATRKIRFYNSIVIRIY